MIQSKNYKSIDPKNWVFINQKILLTVSRRDQNGKTFMLIRMLNRG